MWLVTPWQTASSPWYANHTVDFHIFKSFLKSVSKCTLSSDCKFEEHRAVLVNVGASPSPQPCAFLLSLALALRSPQTGVPTLAHSPASMLWLAEATWVRNAVTRDQVPLFTLERGLTCHAHSWRYLPALGAAAILFFAIHTKKGNPPGSRKN